MAINLHKTFDIKFTEPPQKSSFPFRGHCTIITTFLYFLILFLAIKLCISLMDEFMLSVNSVLYPM